MSHPTELDGMAVLREVDMGRSIRALLWLGVWMPLRLQQPEGWIRARLAGDTDND